MEQRRRDRIAKNEVSFRSINETLDQGLRTIESEPGELAGFVCECGDVDCAALVRVELSKFAEVRSDPRWFLVVPGHDIPSVEDVVEHGERHSIVQKHEDVCDIVEGDEARR